MSKLVLAAMFVAIGDAAAAQTATENPFGITIRSYKLSVSQEEFGVARRLVSGILGEAGLAVSWLHCPSSETPASIPMQCAQPLSPNELILKVERAPRGLPRPSADANGPPEALGMSLVDSRAGGGVLATVYSDPVRNLARVTGVDTADVLARAIAHEIGHLLLGSRHASSGVMRGRWSRAEVRRNEPSDWRFSEAESRTMRNAITARTALRYAGRR